MKRLLLFNCVILIFILCCSSCSKQESQSQPRIHKKFDFGWKFHRGEIAPAIDQDISEWREVDLPHDWSIEDIPGTDSPFDSTAINGRSVGFTVGGTSWYVKEFSLGKRYKNRTITVLFEGVYMDADVWINGHHLGNHPYGYTSFYYDLTDYLKTDGSTNRLAVQVQNEGSNSRWYSGSGIYRHVWLTATNPVHIAQWGTFIKTKSINDATAQIEVTTKLQNDRAKDEPIALKLEVLNPKGAVVSKTEEEITIGANKTLKSDQNLQIKNPSLWSIDAPYQYKLRSSVIQDGKTLDKTTNTFGVRTLEFDPDKGFLLNGEVTQLRGGNMHHDNGPLGSNAYDRAEERRVQLMKENGFNAIRTAHNPPSPGFLNACDSIGMLVIDELYDGWFHNGPKKPYYNTPFEEAYKKEVKRFVKRDRNHPSVILWSTGNEIMNKMTEKSWKIQRNLVGCFKKFDPTRDVTNGVNIWSGNYGADENRDTVLKHFVAPLDIASYNYAVDQYEEDFNKYPNRLILGSESFPSNMFGYLMKMEDHHYVIGDFVWTGFDYLGEAGIGWMGMGEYPWTVAYCGDIDICGFKRPQSYYREILWGTGDRKVAAFVKKPEPTFKDKKDSPWAFDDVYACWTWPGYEGKEMQVDVYSRCEKVTLHLNGDKIGTRATNRSNEYTASFKVTYHPGTLKASAYNGEELIDTFTLQTAGEPEQLKLTADRKNINANGQDLAYIVVEVVDEQGIRRPFDQRLVNFEISGPGKIAGVGSSNPKSVESFQQNKRTTFKGRCIAIVKAEKNKGTITVTAKSEGFPDNQIKLVSK
ncbi:MAG: DUF4982 domain-containing protein [Bacteroidales bacterium]|nr:DUF4982 domain-containing protein [Bacteroidales bacterium]